MESLHHGWIAIATYASEAGRTRCVASVAETLMQLGDHDAAEDAWSYVALASDEHYYLVYAQESLAHICALRGDRVEFLRYAAKSDALGWATGASSATADALRTRGLSYEALGEPNVAKNWLEKAVQFAERRGYNRILFEAEEALRRLEAPAPVAPKGKPAPAAPLEVREGLRAMRRQVVGVMG
jgi:tetratricopeptide (TPR) repeat protein